MTKCLMLDVDGVIISGPDGQSWARDIKRDLGIDPDLLETHFFIPHWPEIVAGKKALRAVLEECLPVLAAPVSPDDFMAYWFERDSTIDHDVLAACDRLRARGTRIFLATNQEHLRAEYLMAELKLSDRVDGIVYSAAVGAKKPDPAFFEAAEAKSGFAGADHILVDDQLRNIEAARAFGWHALHWTGGEDLEALVDAVGQREG
ncbi:MAG: haloacid dehalogenase [Martelella sp.]|uniref:HAD-IA family hydrolase n=1 Tax=unclassified Martelella TaxID=2629616 RepID=UPI000C46BCAF|nr:HAD-IA family hydrolase [Martelella sp.]MAU19016.1 haloacid dehalogenase [Martelella sp.]